MSHPRRTSIIVAVIAVVLVAGGIMAYAYPWVMPIGDDEAIALLCDSATAPEAPIDPYDRPRPRHVLHRCDGHFMHDIFDLSISHPSAAVFNAGGRFIGYCTFHDGGPPICGKLENCEEIRDGCFLRAEATQKR